MSFKAKHIASIIFIISFIACKETKLASDKIEALNEEEPQLIFSNINTHYTEDTKSILKMKAKKQLRFQDGRERYPEGIYIEMYEVDGRLKSTLLADSAIYLPKEKIWLW